MITKIGIVAGEIWQLLDSEGSMRLKEINGKVERPESLILMSLGWLSREGHVILDKEEDDFIVTLRDKKESQKT